MRKDTGILWRGEYVPKGTLLLEREWITREIVAIYVDYRECGYRPTKIRDKDSSLRDK